jgi:SAM-dependent methyltransferase
MSNQKYTERQNWEAYWAGYQPEIIEEKTFFQSLFNGIPDGENKKTFIEVGGFPGTFSVYFKKFKRYKVTLLDYFVSYPTVYALFEKNQLSQEDIEVKEADFLCYTSDTLYDFVFSAGFIEHFENTEDILNRHVNLAKKGGKILITLPNLRGFNGWIQKVFHKSNYDIHNIKCMDIELLTQIGQNVSLSDLKVYYYGKPTIWLEKTAPCSSWIRKIVKITSLCMKLIPFRGRMFSPYIVIEGYRK